MKIAALCFLLSGCSAHKEYIIVDDMSRVSYVPNLVYIPSGWPRFYFNCPAIRQEGKK